VKSPHRDIAWQQEVKTSFNSQRMSGWRPGGRIDSRLNAGFFYSLSSLFCCRTSQVTCLISLNFSVVLVVNRFRVTVLNCKFAFY
jgi:hypothetical protein